MSKPYKTEMQAIMKCNDSNEDRRSFISFDEDCDTTVRTNP